MAYDILYEFSGKYESSEEPIRDQDFKFNLKKEPGMCLGISCDWAMTSLKLNGVKSRDQLNPARWAIIQSAYLINVRNILRLVPAKQFGAVVRNSGLTITNNGGRGQLYRVNSADSVVMHLERVNGTCVWALLGGAAGSHAMGWRRGPNLVEFVDPNTGHYKGDEVDELLDLVRDEINDRYLGLLGYAFFFEVRL